MSSTDSIAWARTSAAPGRTGANVMPQLPITTDVTPCQHDDDISGSHPICASRWEWRSTKPGRHEPAVGVDGAVRGAGGARLGDRGDPVAVDRDVGPSAGRAGAVDDGPVGDDEVVGHGQLPASAATIGATVSIESSLNT